ncbi:hypothetical protein HPB50_001568 [Hyalomma asiaticum]|uniref:Uncharacterized protein n=1 Tax=Hyalomma asiaticum TaxID=266040 RepID=A0ACB7SP13_HYAAI|nr:hypothetical protein HPB50_001568 [Hyalomma asiaticum]
MWIEVGVGTTAAGQPYVTSYKTEDEQEAELQASATSPSLYQFIASKANVTEEDLIGGEKAEIFASQMNCNNFSCSSGRLARFKACRNVSARVVCEEAAHADHKGAAERQNGLLPATLGNYAMGDIFNLDELALFYRFLPNRTLAFKGENCTRGKRAEEWLMLLAMECGKAYCIDMQGAMHLLAYLWQQVESTTLQNCFARAMFVVHVSTGKSEECADDCDSQLTEVLERQGSGEALHFESFHDLDSTVTTSPDLTDSKIVADVVPREVEDDENDDDDGDVEADSDPSPSLTEVADAVAVMRAFAKKKRRHGKNLKKKKKQVPRGSPLRFAFVFFPRFQHLPGPQLW